MLITIKLPIGHPTFPPNDKTSIVFYPEMAQHNSSQPSPFCHQWKHTVVRIGRSDPPHHQERTVHEATPLRGGSSSEAAAAAAASVPAAVAQLVPHPRCGPHQDSVCVGVGGGDSGLWGDGVGSVVRYIECWTGDPKGRGFESRRQHKKNLNPVRST